MIEPLSKQKNWITLFFKYTLINFYVKKAKKVKVMILGTAFFKIFHWWFIIVQMVFFNPLVVLKVAFLWLSMSFAISYLFFLLLHKHDVVQIRANLAQALGKSFVMGFFAATLLAALYQFILDNFMISKFFATQQNMIQSLHIFSSEFMDLYKKICFFTVLLSGLFAAHYVGEMLDTWYEKYIAHRYGWSIMAATLLCWGFLWGVNYVI